MALLPRMCVLLVFFFHKTLSSIHTQFIHEFGEGRSSLLNVVRKALPIILKGVDIDVSLLMTAGADRSNNAALTTLLCFPHENKSTLYPPLLFPSPVRHMKDVFTGSIVMKVSINEHCF